MEGVSSEAIWISRIAADVTRARASELGTEGAALKMSSDKFSR